MEPPASFRELLERYREGERDFSGADLDQDPGDDLTGVCLDGADFSRAWLRADFRRASLRGARFREATVKACDFRGADLREADFSGAALCGADFEGAVLDGARFVGAYYHSNVFGESDKAVT